MCYELDPVKTDLLLKAISATATVAIGVAASVLAYQQYKLSKTKLRLDLYDKRYALFLTIRMYVSDLAIGDNNEPLVSQANAGKFKRDTIECRFLFDSAAIANYFDEVYEKAIELAKTRLAFERPNLDPHEEDAMRERMTALRVWFFNQSDEMFRLFGKDLSVRSLK